MEAPSFDAPPPMGHNNPSMIEAAESVWGRLSAWLADHPVIQDEELARRAKLQLDLANGAIKDLEAAREKESRPLHEAWKACLARFKPSQDKGDKLISELKKRLKAFLDAEEAKRRAAAAEAARLAAEADRLAREAVEREREAIENASLGEIGVDVGEVVGQTDDAIREAERAANAAKIAERDAHVRLGGGFGRATSLRTKKSLVLDDPAAALAAIGITDDIREAILKSARAYQKLNGRPPAGVREIEEQVL